MAQSDHLANAFVRQNVMHSYELWGRYERHVPKSTADAILFREIQLKNNDILFSGTFKAILVGIGKNMQISQSHMFFIPLTLAWSPKRCVNTQPCGLMFKWLSWDLANYTA